MLKRIIFTALLLATPAAAQVVAPVAKNAANQPIQTTPVISVDTAGNYMPPGAPSAAVAAGASPVTGSAVASSLILKASAGNGYRYAVTAGASAGFLMVLDSPTVPADGAVTPKICRAVAANSSLEVDHSVVPDTFAAGIVEVFSTTGCYIKTASATAALEGIAK